MGTSTWLAAASALLAAGAVFAPLATADGIDDPSHGLAAASKPRADVDSSGPSGASRIAIPSDVLVCADGLRTRDTCALPRVPPCCPPRTSSRGCPSWWDEYVPVVPVGPTRTMYTTPVMPPTPWLLTQGEAATPTCGRFGFNLSRISDERQFTDKRGNQYEFDGEEQVLMFEVVSPRIESTIVECVIPFHIGANLSMYTNNYAWFEGLRNFVENDLLNASQGVADSHSIGGKEDSITDPTGARTNLLDTVEPLMKADALIKFPLPDRRVGSYYLEGALTFEFGFPAFGTKNRSGNTQFQFDMTIAGALPVSEHFRLTGAANLAVPGESGTLADFGIDHNTVVPAGMFSAEWWPTHKFAVSLGLAGNGPYTKDTGTPTDLASVYVNFGVLWRPTPKWELHVLFSENPGGLIAVNGTPSTNYTWDTQRDADFSVTIGTTVDF